MARAGIKKAISLIGRKIGSGTRGGLRRTVRAGAHLIASKTAGGSTGKIHRRAGHAITNVIGRLSPKHGLHVRKMAPVVLLAAALAESAHAPLMRSAKAMSWNPPGASRVQSHAGDAAQSAAKKSDAHGPAGIDQLLAEKPVKISPDFKLWDQPKLNPDPIVPQGPISMIHDHPSDPVIFGPTNGGGGSDVTPIVHGAAYGGDGGGGAGGGGGAAGGGGGGAGSGGGASPTVLSPTEIVAVPEPVSMVWMVGIGVVLRRPRRSATGV